MVYHWPGKKEKSKRKFLKKHKFLKKFSKWFPICMQEKVTNIFFLFTIQEKVAYNFLLLDLSELESHDFHLAHFNYAVKTDEGEYPPCEVAIVKYSLLNGIAGHYHDFVDPGRFSFKFFKLVTSFMYFLPL